MKSVIRRHDAAVLLPLLFLLAAHAWAATPPPAALVLRDKGLAELENEKPDQAEAAYRQLIQMLPADPLGHANLAIALVRQQKGDEALRAIGEALRLAPGRADLLAIRGDVLAAANDLDGALASYEAALKVERDDPELIFAAYQLAQTSDLPRAVALAEASLRRLVELRPDNLVLILQSGQRAVAAGDRAAAAAAFLRTGELLWQANAQTRKAYEDLRLVLERGDVAAARVPGLRLENVLKATPMYRESLRELKTGVLGNPVRRLREEAPPQSFGPSLAVRFAHRSLRPGAQAGRALAVGDLGGPEGEERADVAWVDAQGRLEVVALSAAKAASPQAVTGAAKGAAAGASRLLTVDLDNDGRLDLLAFGAQQSHLWRGAAEGGAPALVAGALGLAASGARAAVALDYDIEGDLDLAMLLPDGKLDIWRNNLAGDLERVGAKTLPPLSFDGRALAAADLDRDGDVDLLVGHARGLTWLDNLRQGRFRDRSADAGLASSAAIDAVAIADLDDDGLPEIVAGGPGGLAIWRNAGGGRFAPWSAAQGLPTSAVSSVLAFDADNDGRLDLAAVGPTGVAVLLQSGTGRFTAAALEGAPKGVTEFAAADLDDDGDLDLAMGGAQGLGWLENLTGNQNGWLKVRLRGITTGNSKNNALGIGSQLELRAGAAAQYREASGDVVHFGLGRVAKAEVLRVVWTNGVPQNRLAVAGNQRVFEEQVLKGSCPFVYAWTGKAYEFVTDLLWGAPIGLPAAPGVWVGSDASEIVRLDGLVDDDGIYRMRLTEELWEATFFDHVKLWVVDHPPEVEVASNLRIVPGAPPQPEKVLGVRELRPLAAAIDGHGHEVTGEVALRDEVYADGYTFGPYQGIAEPWTFTMDLGQSPAAPIRLWMEGWIFPSDASLNLAVAQRADLPYLPPVLEVETAGGWQTLMPTMGFPPGKTKVMAVDTPPLPADARRLRIKTSLWLHWDRIQWSLLPDDAAPEVVARLEPAAAEMRFRGFSALVRRAPNAPHAYDYQRTSQISPWQPFPGRYSRYGDVLPLLTAADDFLAILAPGDEIAVEFDARGLAAPPPGWRRTLFLESHGWDKDADRNTGEGERLEPLPFHAMRSYPYAEGETYPDTPGHRRYVEEWLTREIEAVEPPPLERPKP